MASSIRSGRGREAVLRVLVPVELHAHAAHQREGGLAPQDLADVVVEEVGVADDGVGPAVGVGGGLHPGDLVDGAGLGPVGLDVDRLLDAGAGDVGEVLLDRVVAADRLVGAEDARDHRALQPGEVGLAPDVVMPVDDADHAGRLPEGAPGLAAGLALDARRCGPAGGPGRRGCRRRQSASRSGRMPAMARVTGR